MLYHAKHPVQKSSADGQDGIDLAIVNPELVQQVSTTQCQFPCSCLPPSPNSPYSSSPIVVEHRLLIEAGFRQLECHASECVQAVNWDGRVEEASQALPSASAPDDLVGGILRYHSHTNTWQRFDLMKLAPSLSRMLVGHAKQSCTSTVQGAFATLCSLSFSSFTGCSFPSFWMALCRCAKDSDGLLHVQVKDEWCIQAIKSCFAAGNDGQVFNLVQQIGWGHSAFAHPDPASDGSDVGDCPGSWSSQTVQTSRQLHPEGNMAYPMRVGRILRPVPAIEASSPVVR